MQYIFLQMQSTFVPLQWIHYKHRHSLQVKMRVGARCRCPIMDWAWTAVCKVGLPSLFLKPRPSQYPSQMSPVQSSCGFHLCSPPAVSTCAVLLRYPPVQSSCGIHLCSPPSVHFLCTFYNWVQSFYYWVQSGVSPPCSSSHAQRLRDLYICGVSHCSTCADYCTLSLSVI